MAEKKVQKEHDDRVLKVPEGVGPQGMVTDLNDAMLKSLIALPECILEVVKAIGDLCEVIDPINLYITRKGLSENLLTPEDLDNREDDEEQSGPDHGDVH